MKRTSKGILVAVVLIPLAFQLGVLLNIDRLLEHENEFSTKYARAVIVLIASQRLNDTMRDIAFRLKNLYGEPQDASFAKTDSAKLQENLQELKNVVQSDSSKQAGLKQVEDSVKTGIEAVNELDDSNKDVAKMKGSFSKFAACARSLQESLGELTENEREMPEIHDSRSTGWLFLYAVLSGVFGLIQMILFFQFFKLTKNSTLAAAAMLPVLIQLGACGYMWLQHKRTEPQVYARAVLLTSKAYSTSTMISDAAVSLSGYSLTRNSMFEDRFENIVEAIPNYVNELRELIKVTSQPVTVVDEIDRLTKQTIELMKKHKKELELSTASSAVPDPTEPASRSVETISKSDIEQSKKMYEAVRKARQEITVKLDEVINYQKAIAKEKLDSQEPPLLMIVISATAIAYLLQLIFMLTKKD